MKLQKTTIILILLALGFGGFVYFYELQGANVRQEAKEKQQQIFLFTSDDVQSLRVQTKDVNLLIERSPTDNPQWLLKSPIETAASNAAVSYLMDLLVKGKREREINVPLNQLAEYGLDRPQATIEVKLKNQQTHQLILGKPDFNGRLLYAQANPPAKPQGNVDVLLVSKDFENAVKRELSEWQKSTEDNINKSNLNTPQPTPTSLPTPSKTP
jgi:hypothetical protein